MCFIDSTSLLCDSCTLILSVWGGGVYLFRVSLVDSGLLICYKMNMKEKQNRVWLPDISLIYEVKDTVHPCAQ